MTAWPAIAGTLVMIPKPVPDPLPAGFRHGERLHTALRKDNPDTGAPLPVRSCSFGALLLGEAGWPLDTPLPGDALLLHGTQHLVVPGSGNIVVVMLVKRKAGLTPQQFRRRWLEGHAPFGLATGAAGYRQLHPEHPPDDDSFDGAGMVFFRDRDHVSWVRSGPAVAQAATRDEMAFIDHGRSMLAMFRFRPD